MTKNISRQNFYAEVISNHSLALVQFKTEWSGACQIIAPVYEELARAYKGVVHFYCADIEKDGGLERDYGITELPTILFFKGGKVIDHIVGLTPKNIFIHKIESAIELTHN